MIDSVTGWFEVTQYNNKKAMTITNLVKTMLMVQYPCPLEITYDQGGELFGHEFKNSLIEQEYGIKTNPVSSGNPQTNAVIEKIHQVLGNLIHSFNLSSTNVDDTNPWIGILMAAAFAVGYTYYRTTQTIPGKLVFGRDMILPINRLENRIIICQHNRK